MTTNRRRKNNLSLNVFQLCRLGFVTAMLSGALLSFGILSASPANADPCDDGVGSYDSGCAPNEHCDEGTLQCQSGANSMSSTNTELCHFPAGCPSKRHTITVSPCALPAHLNHGDSLGACPECINDSECTVGEFCNLSVGQCQPPDGPCDDDSDCVNGQICNLATGTCQNPDGPCDDDSDCAGGQVCNLATGTCQNPGGPCDDDSDCVGGEICNVSTGQCQLPDGPCTSDSDCVAGQICNTSTGLCENPSSGCKSDADCESGLVCDTGTGICVECLSDTNCQAGEICNLATNTCEAAPGCMSNADCQSGYVCNVTTGECEPEPTGCTDDAECPVGQICNLSTGECEPPSACANDEDCPEGEICNLVTGRCHAPGACIEDSDCPASQVCDNDACVTPEKCTVDAHCASLDNFCGSGACNVDTGDCYVEPSNEGLDCSGSEPDVCSIGGVCSDGACIGVPLCDTECSLCNGGECESMCGNPYDPAETGITIADALYVLRTGVELEQCALCVCDVNNDGTVSAVDALIVLRKVVKLPEAFECPAHSTTTTTIVDVTTTSIIEATTTTIGQGGL